MATKFRQGPQESIDYFVDVLNDIITDTLWTLSPPTGTGTLGTDSFSLTRAICRLSGVPVGQVYFLQCDVTLQSGQVRTSRCEIIGGYAQ